ncbi:MAG: hypothetical protein HRT69_17400 [Flavobacteriaceae bacterium]|nr:hypothetical protein [Flavobacteriaceae bacterium]
MRILKPTIPKPIQAKVLKPSPKVAPKIKPVPVVDKVVPETTVQRQQIKTPVVKKEITSAEKLAITKPKKIAAGLQEEAPAPEKKTGIEGNKGIYPEEKKSGTPGKRSCLEFEKHETIK